MKKILFFCSICVLTTTCLHAQSFMDKMKAEKSQSAKKSNPPQSSNQSVYGKPPTTEKVNPTANILDAYPNAVDMHFRYTDQVQGGRSLNLKVGDRIMVVPGQVVSDTFLNRKLDVYNGKIYYGKTGLSFDPKNPKICGEIFTVASTNPIKFTEEFPENMRNGFNSSFTFKVIKL